MFLNVLKPKCKPIKVVTILLFVLLPLNFLVSAQEIQGVFIKHPIEEIKLVGFEYFDSFQLGKTTTDALGNFTMSYPKDYKGMAMLQIQQSKTLLILDGKSVHLSGTNLIDYEHLQYINNQENNSFLKVARRNAENDKAYAGLRYLKKVYANASFKNKKAIVNEIQKELSRIENENTLEIYNVTKDDYLYWYAPTRKLISDMPQSYSNYTERIPNHIQQFKSIDFTHPYLKTSGLLGELLEGYYIMLENTGQSLDSVYVEMNKSTDYLIDNVKDDTILLNLISKQLFNLFEKRSLFEAASHLANKLLNNSNCNCLINKKLENLLQKYVQLKVGNTAPDVQLSSNKKLSDIKKSILLVFGSSTCKACKQEAISLLQFYDKWKAQKTPIEVIYISLDTHKTVFQSAFKNAPWKTYNDFKGWEGKAVQDYFVNATPAYFLLDKNLKILLHPKSIAHAGAWIQGKL